jgi:hypothetical protein
VGALVSGSRYARYAGLAGLSIAVLFVVSGLLAKTNGASGIAPGHALAPFAVPLVTSSLEGDANVATRAGQGAAGEVPACRVRGTRVLNVCELYEQGPVVLALFVDEGGCEKVLGRMQALLDAFPGVRFAAVSIEGDRAQLRRLVRADRLTLPVGIDKDGALAALYKVFSCPQLNFAYPGGVVQSKALLQTPSLAVLHARVSELIAGARARGWRRSSA